MTALGSNQLVSQAGWLNPENVWPMADDMPATNMNTTNLPNKLVSCLKSCIPDRHFSPCVITEPLILFAGVALPLIVVFVILRAFAVPV